MDNTILSPIRPGDRVIVATPGAHYRKLGVVIDVGSGFVEVSLDSGSTWKFYPSRLIKAQDEVPQSTTLGELQLFIGKTVIVRDNAKRPLALIRVESFTLSSNRAIDIKGRMLGSGGEYASTYINGHGIQLRFLEEVE